MATTGPSGNQARIAVLTYNVLAQVYVRSSFFPYCRKDILRWKNRSEALRQQFLSFAHPKPTVLCLQEVDQYEEFWSGLLSSLGFERYASIINQPFPCKNPRVLTPMLSNPGLSLRACSTYQQKGTGKKDGLVIAWDPEKVELHQTSPVMLDEVADDIAVRTGNAQVAETYKRGNVALFSVFRTKDGDAGDESRKFILATTHIFWDPLFAHVKLAQADYILKKLTAFKADVGAPVLFCGDLNSLPDSEVYRLITKGEHALLPETSAKRLTFSSAYASVGSYPSAQNHEREPDFTTYVGQKEAGVPGFKGCLDYIFYEPDSFEVVGVSPLISEEEAQREGGLPNSRFPSDHLPLLAELTLRGSS